MFKKMTPPQLQMHISQLIIEYTKTGVCPAHICIWGDRLEIRYCGHTSIPHPSFMKFTEATLRRGLSLAEWFKLVSSIYNYVRRNE